ncbi:hypothetical protein [Streptomyces sp.]|uniref:hypothetical protein n=1 Tax=Streptomyces sp. TaxID=1931 RepID=UPI002F3F0150
MTGEDGGQSAVSPAWAYAPWTGPAVAYAPAAAAEPQDGERHVSRTPEARRTGDRHALVLELPGPDAGDALWTHWTRGHHPTTLYALPDCPSTDRATREPCCGYAGHPGVHSYELNDPWSAPHPQDAAATATDDRDR